MPRLCLTDGLESAIVPGDGAAEHVLRRPERADGCVRLGDVPADLVLGLDGERELETVLSDAERRHGGDGPALLVRLLAELGDRGFLRDVGRPTGDRYVAAVSGGRLGGVLRPRRWSWRAAADVIEAIYRRGGRHLVSAGALAAYCGAALIGLIAFGLLLERGGVTPFVVGGGLGLGVVCFLGGRAALVLVHELAHGLTLQRYGRRVDGAGISFVAIFPYAYVDTSAAWMEPRRHRMLVTAAGPLSDLTLGGAAAIAALCCHGVAAELGYQLALAGYLAALLNLNPCLERDGYFLLSDALRLPALRSAGVRSLASALAGRGGSERRALRWHGLAMIAWGMAGSGLLISSLWGTLATLRSLLPHDLSLALMIGLWLVLLIPTALLVGRPLTERVRRSADRSSAPGRLAPLSPPVGVLATRAEPPILQLARQVISDASMRQRIRGLGTPAGFEVLGPRELRSSIAGVLLAAAGESLAATHLIDTVAPAVGHFVSHVADDTSLDRIKSILGIDHTATTAQRPHLAPSLVAPDASKPEPVLYEPAPGGGASGRSAHAGAGAGVEPVVSGVSSIDGVSIGAWPGNDAGDAAIAHWMAAGARSAGLPGELPVMAALVESNLDNNACCNADSLGYFQMRESVWNYGPWTGYAEHPELQLSWFITEAVSVQHEMIADGYPTFGEHASDWGTWVADIENPAAQYRYRYGLQLGSAESLLDG